MLTKSLALLASLSLLLAPLMPAANRAIAPASGPLAQTALVTGCIGPMTLQIAPKDQGFILLSFGAGGCSSEAQNSGFAIRFGQIKTITKTTEPVRLIPAAQQSKVQNEYSVLKPNLEP